VVSAQPQARRGRGMRIAAVVLAVCGAGLYVLAVCGAALFALPALDTHRGGDGFGADFASALRVLGALFSLAVLMTGLVGAVLGFVARAWIPAVLNAVLCITAVIVIATTFRI